MAALQHEKKTSRNARRTERIYDWWVRSWPFALEKWLGLQLKPSISKYNSELGVRR